MRKRAIVIFFLAAVHAISYGQGYRTMSVWTDGKANEYSLLTLDSLVMGNPNGKAAVHYEKRGYTKNVTDSFAIAQVDSITFSVPDVTSTNTRSIKELTLEFQDVSAMGNPYKKVGNHNPLMGHKFGADPFGMVDGDRLYVYMTDDHIYSSSTGKPVPDSDYGDCKNVSIISSDDLVNWTDHGSQPVAGAWGAAGPAKWASNMWAPCAAHKTIDGKEKYFLYFADASNGIGVLTADSPTGPWKQPEGMNQLISRSTPNCESNKVPWLFDPAVLIDDDGKAYLYFGGGVDGLDQSNPGSARCVQLGDDMISIVGTPQTINPPYLFEDAGINKVGGKYLYSYCSNWTDENTQKANGGPGTAKIAYMESDKPLGPFSYVDVCFDNPGGASWSGGGGNNHHSIVKYKGKYYILYHNRALKKAMRMENKDITDGMEVRSTCMTRINVDEENHTISHLSASSITEAGVSQLKSFDPYKTVPGPTMAWSKGVSTKYFKSGADWICTAEMKNGGWMCLSNVDFGSGAIGFRARVKGTGILAVTVGFVGSSGTLVALAEVDASTGYTDIQVPLHKPIKGVQSELYLMSVGNISLESWSFIQSSSAKKQGNNATIPRYWIEHLKTKLSEIDTVVENSSQNRDSFYFLTDYHIESNIGRSHRLVQYLQKRCSVNNLVFGGDVFNGNADKQIVLGYLQEFYRRFNNVNLFGIRGNHDYNLNDGGSPVVELSNSEIYDFLIDKIANQVVMGGEDCLYYYRDVDSLKLRYIYLDAGYETLGQSIDDTQIQWMKDRINELETGWCVVLFSHQLFNINDVFGSPVTTNPGYNWSGTRIIDALRTITPNAEIIAIISGHCHCDFSTDEHGFWEISTTCDALQEYGGLPETVGTVNEQAFDVFFLDLGKRTLNAIRIGRGTSRYWTF